MILLRWQFQHRHYSYGWLGVRVSVRITCYRGLSIACVGVSLIVLLKIVSVKCSLSPCTWICTTSILFMRQMGWDQSMILEKGSNIVFTVFNHRVDTLRMIEDVIDHTHRQTPEDYICRTCTGYARCLMSLFFFDNLSAGVVFASRLLQSLSSWAKSIHLSYSGRWM